MVGISRTTIYRILKK
ncbi:hypothetical protein NGC87_03590 [Staphylococcus pseudoxylosus]|nr:hypothetical protein [Staphylococcus pseudoxylosus]